MADSYYSDMLASTTSMLAQPPAQRDRPRRSTKSSSKRPPDAKPVSSPLKRDACEAWRTFDAAFVDAQATFELSVARAFSASVKEIEADFAQKLREMTVHARADVLTAQKALNKQAEDISALRSALAKRGTILAGMADRFRQQQQMRRARSRVLVVFHRWSRHTQMRRDGARVLRLADTVYASNLVRRLFTQWRHDTHQSSFCHVRALASEVATLRDDLASARQARQVAEDKLAVESQRRLRSGESLRTAVLAGMNSLNVSLLAALDPEGRPIPQASLVLPPQPPLTVDPQPASTDSESEDEDALLSFSWEPSRHPPHHP